MQYKPIKSGAQYRAYESYLSKLILVQEKSDEQVKSLELLETLIQQWDKNHMTTSLNLAEKTPGDPVVLLNKFLKYYHLNPSTLASSLGISQSKISDILNYRIEFPTDLMPRFKEKYLDSHSQFLKNALS